MMTSLSPVTPSSLVGPTPMALGPATPDTAPESAKSPPAFAQALDRASLAQAQDSSTDQHDDRPADGNTPPTANNDAAARRTAEGKRWQRTAPTTPGEAQGTPREAQGLTMLATLSAERAFRALDVKAAEEAPDAAQGDAAAPALIDLAALMSGLAPPTRSPRDVGDAGDGTDTGDADTINATTGHSTPAPRTTRGNGHAEAAATQEPGQAATASPGREDRTGGSMEALATTLRQHDGSQSRQGLESIASNPNTISPTAAASAATATRTAASAAQFQGELMAALGTPEFAPALGAQVSVLIRDGVSQAQLHLNPADMGPISVRIRLDGDSAQVDFSALQALTRQALEDAVPALASALRESGLTLSGGGVFEQPRQSDPRDPTRADAGEQHGSASSRKSSHAADPSTMHGTVSRTTRARGMVDLYA